MEGHQDISLDWFDRLVPEVGGGESAEDLELPRNIAGGSQGARPKFVAQLSQDGARLRSSAAMATRLAACPCQTPRDDGCAQHR